MENFNINNYGYLRVAAAVPECKVLDLDFNFQKIEECVNYASQNNAQIIVFPELALTSYSAADLFYQKNIHNRINYYLEGLCELSEKQKICIIVGFPALINSKLFNCAAVISNNMINAIVPKKFLPASGEFYEERWFASADLATSNQYDFMDEKIYFGSDVLFNVNSPNLKAKFAVEICEDLWAPVPPSSYSAINGANIIFNLSASNEYLGKSDYRRNLVAGQSGRLNSAYIYASAGPGESTTDLVYSGHAIIAENGTILKESQILEFESQIIIADIDVDKLTSERIKNNTYSLASNAAEKSKLKYWETNINISDCSCNSLNRIISKTPFIPGDEQSKSKSAEEIFKLQSTALIKRLKHISCSNIVLGLSGGLDSTLALLVAIDAFRRMKLDLKGIHCILMPGFGTTERTKSNAEKLAYDFGTSIRIIPIHKAVEQHFRDIHHNPEETSIVYENAQARERTQILMDISNQVAGIVLGTGDLSEIALGWSTYNADHISMYNVNCGVPKTLVKYIIKWCSDNKYTPGIKEVLNDIFNTPISPELLPPDKDGAILQKTEDNIGSYILNDFFLYHFIRFGYEPLKLYLLANIAFKEDFTEQYIKNTLKSFYKRFFNAQFKRSCVPDGPKIGTVSLSPRGDWRMSTDTSVNFWLNQVEQL